MGTSNTALNMKRVLDMTLEEAADTTISNLLILLSRIRVGLAERKRLLEQQREPISLGQLTDLREIEAQLGDIALKNFAKLSPEEMLHLRLSERR